MPHVNIVQYVKKYGGLCKDFSVMWKFSVIWKRNFNFLFIDVFIYLLPKMESIFNDKTYDIE